MRVAIIENTRITHHGQVGVALHEVGALIDLYRPWKDGVLPEPGSFDALVSFGGEQSALDDHSHPYLPRLASLMAEEAAAGTAVLGVCLGAQVMARGLGSVNQLGVAPEFGWCEVTRVAGAEADPMMSALPHRFPIFEWHADTYSLPPGAVHLAETAVAAVQCYRYGRAGYGMQFHFEASRAVARDWARTFPDLIERIAPGWREALANWEQSHGAAADGHGLALARAWVGLIQAA
jgi:GMP synthase-like glutamine amidotransferase